MKKFEIWSEGTLGDNLEYISLDPKLHGVVSAHNFKDACIYLSVFKPSFGEHFNSKLMVYSMCKLFDNKEDAFESLNSKELKESNMAHCGTKVVREDFHLQTVEMLNDKIKELEEVKHDNDYLRGFMAGMSGAMQKDIDSLTSKLKEMTSLNDENGERAQFWSRKHSKIKEAAEKALDELKITRGMFTRSSFDMSMAIEELDRAIAEIEEMIK